MCQKETIGTFKKLVKLSPGVIMCPDMSSRSCSRWQGLSECSVSSVHQITPSEATDWAPCESTLLPWLKLISSSLGASGESLEPWTWLSKSLLTSAPVPNVASLYSHCSYSGHRQFPSLAGLLLTFEVSLYLEQYFLPAPPSVLALSHWHIPDVSAASADSFF